MAIPHKTMQLAEIVSNIVATSSSPSIGHLDLCSNQVLARRIQNQPSLMRLAQDIVAAFDGLPIENFCYDHLVDAIYEHPGLDLKLHLFTAASKIIKKVELLDEDFLDDPVVTYRFQDGKEYDFLSLLPNPVLFDLKY